MKPFKLPVVDDDVGQQAFGGLLSPEPAALRPYEPEPGALECLPLLTACHEALLRCAETGEGFLAPIDSLSAEANRYLDETLGEGEVSLVVGGRHRYLAQESVLPGLWRVTTEDARGETVGRYLEIGDVPSVVRAAEATATLGTIHIANPPPGAMNALPVLAELRHRSHAWSEGQPNHVMSFTLLPMNEIDMAFLEQQLGHGPVRGESKGFSTCKVELTGVRHVWSVKHFNALGNLILDTLEVGDVPAALVAGGNDFEDSAARLAEWLRAAIT